MFLKVYQLRIGHGYATTLEVKNSRSSYILELVLPKYKTYLSYLFRITAGCLYITENQ